jgi:hypothetical protein
MSLPAFDDAVAIKVTAYQSEAPTLEHFRCENVVAGLPGSKCSRALVLREVGYS